MTPSKGSEDYIVIFRKSITLPNGRVIYASDYGKVAFPIRIKKKG